MDTATPAHPTHQAKTDQNVSSEAQPIDPENEIDAKVTSIVLVVSTILVFGTVWVLSYVFAEVIYHQRIEHVEQAPTVELEELRESENSALSGGDGNKSIEQSMEELTKK